jgi:hypothetical protein
MLRRVFMAAGGNVNILSPTISAPLPTADTALVGPDVELPQYDWRFAARLAYVLSHSCRVGTWLDASFFVENAPIGRANGI